MRLAESSGSLTTEFITIKFTVQRPGSAIAPVLTLDIGLPSSALS